MAKFCVIFGRNYIKNKININMSRIGKLPITLPKDVKVAIDDNVVSIKGPFGDSKIQIPPQILVPICHRHHKR